MAAAHLAPRIRPGTHEDLGALVDIYNHYVTRTHVTFDTAPFTVDSRRAWLEQFALTGPYRLFVAEDAGVLLGYACSGQFRPRPAYRTSVETSVYLRDGCIGRGIGRALYSALLEILDAEDGVHRVYAGIALPNPASVQLHERFGFQLAGTFREVGWKLGQFWDVSWYERPV